MFLGLVISVIPRKSVIFGEKSVGVAGLQPIPFSLDYIKLLNQNLHRQPIYQNKFKS